MDYSIKPSINDNDCTSAPKQILQFSNQETDKTNKQIMS